MHGLPIVLISPSRKENLCIALYEAETAMMILALFFFFLNKNNKSVLGGPNLAVINCFHCSQLFPSITGKLSLVDIQDRYKALSKSLDRGNCSCSWESAH